jgi:hypothetical protein
MNAATRKHFTASKKVQKATQTLAQWNHEVNHWYHESMAQKKKLDATLEQIAALPKGRKGRKAAIGRLLKEIDRDKVG